MSLINDVRSDFGKLTFSVKSLRSFAYVMSAALGVLGVLIFFFGSVRERGYWLLGAALLFLIVQAALPTLLKPLYMVWMLLSLLLGWLMSRLLLTLVFFLVIFPISVIMRFLGKDLLNLKLDRQRESYWIKRTHSIEAPERYERMF